MTYFIFDPLVDGELNSVEFFNDKKTGSDEVFQTEGKQGTPRFKIP